MKENEMRKDGGIQRKRTGREREGNGKDREATGRRKQNNKSHRLLRLAQYLGVPFLIKVQSDFVSVHWLLRVWFLDGDVLMVLRNRVGLAGKAGIELAWESGAATS
jgi:hypothetical protein